VSLSGASEIRNEVAATALYLAADATFMTGGEIVVGGGLVYV
jgi:hypothetical protein